MLKIKTDVIVRILLEIAILALIVGAPDLAFAQAGAGSSGPFATGLTSMQTTLFAWLTPLAVILVMALGALAMANRMSWGWCIAAILGIVIAFGATQIVTWIRGMFAV